MKTFQNYAIEVETQLGFNETIQLATELLKEEGFGVLTEIDVKATLKKKLDIDWYPYHILGACNPPYAHRSLKAEPHVGVLLPCNVVIWDEGNRRVVAAMEPAIIGSIAKNDELTTIAADISDKIHSVLKKIETR